MIELSLIQEAFRSHRVSWRLHAQQRMLEREILRGDVATVIAGGEVVELYPDTEPFPGCLIHGVSKRRTIHVVVSYDHDAKHAYVITVYEPDLLHFESDFKTRRRDSSE